MYALTGLVCFALPVYPAGAANVPDDDCAATGACAKVPENSYFWPMARGPVGSHSTSPYRGPRNISSSLKWKWNHPEGRFKTSANNGAALIDDKRNLYTMNFRNILKFSPDGRLLWRYQPSQGTQFNDIAAIMDGLLYSTVASAGNVIAISMATGSLVWQTPNVCAWKSTKPTKIDRCDCATIGMDIGAVGASKGVVTVKTHEPPGGGACKAAGLNASTGEVLWDYAFDKMVWNYYPIFTDDGESFIFQDAAGGVYRLGLDGKEIWTAGLMTHEALDTTWTDGGVQIGPNGVVYAMKALGGFNKGPGIVRAFRVSTGEFLWQSPPIPEVPNAWPVIGRMRPGDPLTVIVASGPAGGHFPIWDNFMKVLLGALPLPAAVPMLAAFVAPQLFLHRLLGDHVRWVYDVPTIQPEVWGLDAETGKVLWKWLSPLWHQGAFRNEVERVINIQGYCLPNPVGNPTLDADGNLYIGVLDGFVYHLVREDNGPGVRLQSKYDAESPFSSGGVSLAPGMMTINSCDDVMVFQSDV